MAISREKKKEIIDELKGILSSSENVTFVNFHGLSVDQAGSMRSALKENGVGYKVAKKTLVKMVLDEQGFEGEIPELEGELAIAYGEDKLAPSREVFKFQKQYEDAVNITGGVFDGAYKNKDEMLEIASIPEPQTLKGMFVNIINSPIQRFAITLNQIAEKKS